MCAIPSLLYIYHSNAIRNDLIHANEYIRGRTLRLLCRMRYFKIMEPLVESILKNLSHRHAYVRRNAVTCVYSIVKTFGPAVIPQAAVEIEQLLLVEGDLSTKRIAFVMLLNCDIDRAINYAVSVEEQVNSLGDVFQLALLELVRKVARSRPGHKGRLMKLVFYLANGSSPAVMFEAAEILSRYGSSPSAAQIAAASYVHLLTSQPDNNVKLIVLDKLAAMRQNESERHIVESLVMDVLRGLSCPALGVRRRIIGLAGESLNSRNVADVVNLLKKEIVKTGISENLGADGNSEFRHLLIHTLQQASRMYPVYAEPVVLTLVDLLRDQSTDAATGVEIISFAREVMSSEASLRGVLLEKLAGMLPDLARSRVARMALWLIGEFSQTPKDHIRTILDCLAPLPVSAGERCRDVDVDKETPTEVTAVGDDNGGEKKVLTTKTVVLADGTYASQAVYGSAAVSASSGNIKSSGIRAMVRGGDFLLCTVTGVVLAKLFVKCGHSATTPQVKNELLFAITCLTRIVKASASFGTKEQVTRLVHCLRVIAEPENKALAVIAAKEWASDACRESLTKLVSAEAALRLLAGKGVSGCVSKGESAGKGIVFRQLKERREALAASDPARFGDALEKDDSSELIPGVISSQFSFSKESSSLFTERLAKATPMTGLADSVYIEGFLRLHSYDLILEMAIVNRTGETLQNILVELCTHGDLKVVDKPQAVTLGPGETATVYATIKVSSTENGVIFGYATLDRKSALDKEWLVLNEVHADVLDYIQPDCVVDESAFKSMWQEFEWENKIVVSTNVASPEEFVKLLVKHTNMALVGSPDRIAAINTLLKTSQFAAVNLYAKSIFGEDALANVSLERAGGELTGTVRIRSRTQGIALSLGDKVSHVQREQKLRGA